MSIKGKDNRHTNVARLSALRTGRLCLPPKEITQVLISVRSHNAALRIKLPKNPNVPHQVSKPQTSRLQRRVSTKCATAYLDKEYGIGGNITGRDEQTRRKIWCRFFDTNFILAIAAVYRSILWQTRKRHINCAFTNFVAFLFVWCLLASHTKIIRLHAC